MRVFDVQEELRLLSLQLAVLLVSSIQEAGLEPARLPGVEVARNERRGGAAERLHFLDYGLEVGLERSRLGSTQNPSVR